VYPGRPVVVQANCSVLSFSPTIFVSTGAEQCFVVPAGVATIHALLIGGSGGSGYPTSTPAPGPPGAGGEAEADVSVTRGESIFVEVGGNGASGGCGGAACGSAGFGGGWGGYNGGASAGVANGCSFPACNYSGGGGGGATDLRTVPAGDCSGSGASIASLNSRLLVAGGGGGGGNASDQRAGTAGGSGGDPPQNGQSGDTAFGDAVGGGAGAWSSGGQAGSGTYPSDGGKGGAFGCGGSGGTGAALLGAEGGGGGGGYYGGGGGGGGDYCPPENQCHGAGAGGGAGSNFALPLKCSAVAFGANATDDPAPRAVVTFTVTPGTGARPTASVAAGTAPPVAAGTPVLRIDPSASSPGFVVQATGSGWTPGAAVRLSWTQIGSHAVSVDLATVPVQANGNTGTFTLSIILRPHDFIGWRVLQATQGSSQASAALLVSPSPDEPPLFVVRR